MDIKIEADMKDRPESTTKQDSLIQKEERAEKVGQAMSGSLQMEKPVMPAVIDSKLNDYILPEKQRKCH